jgi:hypothetical protein
MSTTPTLKRKKSRCCKRNILLTGRISEDNSCQSFGKMRVISGFLAHISGKNLTKRVGLS